MIKAVNSIIQAGKKSYRVLSQNNDEQWRRHATILFAFIPESFDIWIPTAGLLTFLFTSAFPSRKHGAVAKDNVKHLRITAAGTVQELHLFPSSFHGIFLMPGSNTSGIKARIQIISGYLKQISWKTVGANIFKNWDIVV